MRMSDGELDVSDFEEALSAIRAGVVPHEAVRDLIEKRKGSARRKNRKHKKDVKVDPLNVMRRVGREKAKQGRSTRSQLFKDKRKEASKKACRGKVCEQDRGTARKRTYPAFPDFPVRRWYDENGDEITASCAHALFIDEDEHFVLYAETPTELIRVTRG